MFCVNDTGLSCDWCRYRVLRDTSASVQTLLVLGGAFMQSVDMGYQALCRSYLQKQHLTEA